MASRLDARSCLCIRSALSEIIIYDNNVSELETASTQIKARREALGLTLAEVARRADTSPATLSRYEGGWTRFEVYTLRKLATALGCELVIAFQPKVGPLDRPSTSEVVRRLRRLFWDVRLEVNHLETNPLWVVERVLELGDLDDVRQLVGLMGRESFLQHVREARFSSEKTRVFWQQILAREGVPCTTRSFRDKAASFWRASRR
jgi:transcriptional regulator with XRE-family HTH domain